MELVTSILKGNAAIDKIRIACDIFEQFGIKVNKSCGLHVHHASVTATGQKNENILKICAVMYKKWQRKINSMLPSSRRDNNYARPLSPTEIEALKSRDLSRPHGDRYRVVNPEAYARHGTVEFRQHSGTVDYDKIINWVKITMAMVKKAQQIYAARQDAWTLNFNQLEEELNLSAPICKYIDNRIEHFRRRDLGLPDATPQETQERLRENTPVPADPATYNGIRFAAAN
jgi:hypothetical protein